MSRKGRNSRERTARRVERERRDANHRVDKIPPIPFAGRVITLSLNPEWTEEGNQASHANVFQTKPLTDEDVPRVRMTYSAPVWRANGDRAPDPREGEGRELVSDDPGDAELQEQKRFEADLAKYVTYLSPVAGVPTGENGDRAAGTSWAVPMSARMLSHDEVVWLVPASKVERDFALARRVFPSELVEDAIGDVLESLATGDIDPSAYRRLLIRWFVSLLRVYITWLYMKYVLKKKGGS